MPESELNNVRHNEAKHRFEAGPEDHPAHLDYRVRNGAADMYHTEVPAAFQGKGMAAALATAALQWARQSGHKVIPNCSYVEKFIERHPEYSDLV